jgi:hypothetical protein
MPGEVGKIRSFVCSQAGCKALKGHYGIGELASGTIFVELGDSGAEQAGREEQNGR